MGLMLGPANTDAVNRASRLSYGEATGITQTVRNYSASLGLAILGTILVSQMRSRDHHVADRAGASRARARTPRPRISRNRSPAAAASRRFPTSCGSTSPTPRRSVLYVMAAIMAAAAVVALLGLRPGVQEDAPASDADVPHAGPRAGQASRRRSPEMEEDAAPAGCSPDFGRTASDYAPSSRRLSHELLDRLSRAASPQPGARVVDLGTGTGSLARLFASARLRGHGRRHRRAAARAGAPSGPRGRRRGRLRRRRPPRPPACRAASSTWSARGNAGTGSIVRPRRAR